MKKIYKSLKMCLLGALFVSISSSVFGQNQTVTGRVTSDDTEALIGVTVVVRGSTNGTVTDVDGNYAISVPADGVLVFSYVGFKESVIPVNGRSTVDVVLELDLEVLQEIVVVGYGEQNRRDVTGSIVSVKADELSQATPLDALVGMRGRLSGVSIAENGAPGEAADIQIRGNTSLNATGGPLFVVDGQQLDNIDNLNPNDIASVEVLKDGASAAIYGSRSANGVIIVTTKKGKSGKTRIDASYVRSYTSLATKIPVSNTRQARQYELARSGNSNAQTADTPPDSLSQLFNQDFDYQEIITRVAVRDQVGLSLSGGNDNANFYWNGSYLNQEGVVNNSDFIRFNSTLNVNFKVGEKINAGTRFIASYSERNGLNEGAVFGQLATHFPYLPTRDADGTFVPQTSSQQNVEAETLLTVRERRDYDGQFFSFIEIDPLPNLKFTSRLGIIFELQRDNDFNPAIVQPRAEAPSGSENTELNYSLQQENFLTWSKKFGDHNITALAGVQIQKWKEEFSRFESVTFNNDLIRTFNNVEDLTLGDGNTGTTATSHSLASQFGRVSYDYKGKYLVSGTIRRDGSSRFGDDNQYGVFPAVSVGWRISDESFMQPLSRYIADLKFRASIAENGNERIGNFLSVSQYTPGAIYDGVNGTFQSNLGNQALAWESTTQFNYGVDLALLGGRLNVTFDAYRKETSDLLFFTPLPSETGFSQIVNNIGEIENRGVELFIGGTPIDKGAVKWYTSFNIATNNNEILDLAEEDGQIITDRYIYKEGGSIGDFWGYTAQGVFAYDESNAFDDSGNQLTPIFDESGGFLRYELNGAEYTGNINQLTFQNQVLEGGNVYWKDHNGDFQIDPENDRSVIGNALPEFFGGFYNEVEYKGFKFSILFDYNFGNDIYRQYDETRNQRMVRTVLPGPERIEGAWYQPGDMSEFPSLVADSRNNLISNSYWIDDADFIKLRSVRLDYRIPSSIIDRTKILSDVTVYISGNNLLTWTNYSGYNPELGSRGNPSRPGLDNLRYPLSREVIVGINVSL